MTIPGLEMDYQKLVSSDIYPEVSANSLDLQGTDKVLPDDPATNTIVVVVYDARQAHLLVGNQAFRFLPCNEYMVELSQISEEHSVRWGIGEMFEPRPRRWSPEFSQIQNSSERISLSPVSSIQIGSGRSTTKDHEQQSPSKEELEPDAVVRFSPKRRYFVKGRVKSRRRRKPTIIGLE